MLHIIKRGDSEVGIGAHSGKIEKWDVAPRDEKCFRLTDRAAPEEAGY
jgi:hypothetical protein